VHQATNEGEIKLWDKELEEQGKVNEDIEEAVQQAELQRGSERIDGYYKILYKQVYIYTRNANKPPNSP